MLPQRYIPKKISNVKEFDSRVSIMGEVVSAGENSFVIEDSSGKKEVSSGYPVEVGNMIRVFCSVTEGKLKADTVQSLNGIDSNLYQKVEELYRKVGL